jgi:hypothetical protein
MTGWRELDDREAAQLGAKLLRELAEGHPLRGGQPALSLDAMTAAMSRSTSRFQASASCTSLGQPSPIPMARVSRPKPADDDS